MTDDAAEKDTNQRPDRGPLPWALRAEDLTDEEMALIVAARVPPEHDYEYEDDPEEGAKP